MITPYILWHLVVTERPALRLQMQPDNRDPDLSQHTEMISLLMLLVQVEVVCWEMSVLYITEPLHHPSSAALTSSWCQCESVYCGCPWNVTCQVQQALVGEDPPVVSTMRRMLRKLQLLNYLFQDQRHIVPQFTVEIYKLLTSPRPALTNTSQNKHYQLSITRLTV